MVRVTQSQTLKKIFFFFLLNFSDKLPDFVYHFAIWTKALISCHLNMDGRRQSFSYFILSVFLWPLKVGQRGSPSNGPHNCYCIATDLSLVDFFENMWFLDSRNEIFFPPLGPSKTKKKKKISLLSLLRNTFYFLIQPSWLGLFVESPVLETWGLWSTPLLPLLPDPLWPSKVVSVRIPSMGQIEIFDNLLYLKPFNRVQTNELWFVWIYLFTNFIYIWFGIK